MSVICITVITDSSVVLGEAARANRTKVPVALGHIHNLNGLQIRLEPFRKVCPSFKPV